MSDLRQFMVKIDGPAIVNHSIPFKTLVNILDGIQNTFYYIGMEITNREVKSRARVPSDIMQACELKQVMERPGSYEVVAEIPELMQYEMFPDMDLGKVALNKYLGMTEWISGDAGFSDINTIFPTQSHRNRILKSMQRYLPREGDEWSLTIHEPDGTRQYGLFNRQSIQKINRTVYVPQFETKTITGELMRINFDQHRIVVKHKPSEKSLECSYNPEDEDAILENRDGYLLISGLIELDAGGNPDKISNVTDIRFLDLSPVKISRIISDGLVLELNKPLIIEPVFEDQEVVLNYDELNIISVGQDREESIKDFEDDFIWLWREYVMVEDNNLSVDAITLKQLLQDMVGRVIIDTKEA
jgi:hypothetical protein